MPPAWKFDFSSPKSEGSCACCKQMPVQATGQIYREGQPFAVYRALYCNRHPDREIDTLFSVGNWHTSTGEQERVAFHCRVRAIGESYQVMLDDAVESAWAEEDGGAVKLTRAQALEHPNRAKVLESLDEAMIQVPSLNGFLQRCHCGDPSTPLEPSYDAPDVILELAPDVRDTRTKINRSFAVLDEKRFFIRCLIPFLIEGYGRWAPSLWVELSEEENRRVIESWDDPDSYVKLRFEGTAANDLRRWGIELKVGTKLTLAADSTEESPRVVSVGDQSIQTRMNETWAQADFEGFAVERGLL